MSKKTLQFIFFLLITSSVSADPIYLKQEDFKDGTYLIEKPGTYILAEDITFNPNSIKSLKTDAYHAGFLLPSQYTSNGGKYDDHSYGIGFFAAIAISGDDVTLDLNNHTIEQSKEHALQQRFFAVIELANQPFLPGEGPHNFGKKLVGAKNIVIKNGVIGRSSHHGIHGNNNRNITIKNVDFIDFEVAAVSVNGINGLLVENSKASSRVDVPVIGTFSSARFIQPYLDYLVSTNSKTTLNIGGKQEITATMARDRLIQAIDNVNNDLVLLDQETIDPIKHREEYELFHNPSQVIDGNCYGYLINSVGQATNGFRVYADLKPDQVARNIKFDNVHVKFLKGKISEVIALKQNDDPMTDPVGSVFRVMSISPITNEKYTIKKVGDNDFVYVGNLLANAQAIVAKAGMNGDFKDSSLDLSQCSITKDVIRWIESDPATWKEHPFDLSREDLLCNGDSMFHINKGVVGFKIDGASSVELLNTSAENLMNMSEVGSGMCGLYNVSHKNATLTGCGGPKTRGYSLAGSRNINIERSVARNVQSFCGSVAGFDILTDSSNITISDSYVNGINAGQKFIPNAGPNEPPKAIGFRICQQANNIVLNNVSARNLKGYAESKEVLDDSDYALITLNDRNH